MWKNISTEGLPFGLFCGTAMVIVSLWFAWYSIAEYVENYRISKWQPVECDILSSKIEETEEGKKCRFEVSYRYEWQNNSFESDCYRIGWDPNESLHHSEAIELAEKYKAGNRIVCYVNPEEPNEAVLSRDEPHFLGYMVIPVFLFVVGSRQLFLGFKKFIKGDVSEHKNGDLDDVHFEASKSSGVSAKIWKYVTGFGLVVAFILNFPLVFLVSVFLYLSTAALGKQIEDLRKKLIKMEMNVSGKSGTGKVVGKSVHFTIFEKAVLLISIVLYLLIMFLIAKHNTGKGPFYLVVVIFSGLWLGFFMLMTVWMIIAMMHAYHYIALKEKEKEVGYSKFDLPVWSLLLSNLIVIVWAIVERWSLYMIMWIYWGQSLCIGLFLLIRALALKEVVHDLGAPFRKRRKVLKMLRYLFTYILFHCVYMGFLKAFFKNVKLESNLHLVIAFAVGIFFVQQVITFVYDYIKGSGRTDIDSLIGFAALRIVPMHLTIMGAGFLSTAAGLSIENPVMLILFLGLKTFADIAMCLYTRKDFSQKMDVIFEQ